MSKTLKNKIEKKLLRHCAEAKLFETEYFGKKALLKERVEKGYRNKELNKKLIASRVVRECNLLNKAKSAGIRTPVLYKVEKESGRIWMEFVQGTQLKELLKKGKGQEYCRKFGEGIGRLHLHKIVHGDLTTSNVLIHNKELVFIDFGLGFVSGKKEDFAVDLLNLKKVFLASHPLLEKEWKEIVQGYCRVFKKGRRIIEKMKEVDERARYK